MVKMLKTRFGKLVQEENETVKQKLNQITIIENPATQSFQPKSMLTHHERPG